MEPFVVGGKITSRGGCESGLSVHLHPCAEAIPVAACTAQNDESQRCFPPLFTNTCGCPPSTVVTASIQPSLLRSPKAAPRPATGVAVPASAFSNRPL